MILLLVAGAAFLDFLDVTVVNLAFSDMQRDFRAANVGDLAWVVTGYAVPFAALLTPAGRLADMAGRRRLFLAGTSLFLLASLASALAPSLGILIAARVAQGAAAAMMIPSGLGIALASVPLEKRSAAIGVWGAAAAVAALVGPAVGGLLVDTVGWRAVFLINVPLSVLIILGALRHVPATPGAAASARLPDVAGAALVAGGVGAVVLAVTQAPEWGWAAARTLAVGAAGLAAVAVALLRSRRHPAPAVETRLWRIRQFAVANGVSVLTGGAVYAWLLLCVLYATAIWGYSELEAGLAATPGAVSAAFTAALVGRRLESGGHRIAVAGGALLLCGVGVWLVLALTPEPQFLEVWLPAGTVAGVAMGAMTVGISSAVATAVHPDQYAAATGLNLTGRQVGGALGVAVMAAMLQAGDGRAGAYLDVFLVLSLLALGASALALRLGAAPAPAPILASQEA